MKGSPVRIAVNTMRARLTILGFNLAIITFQLTHLSNQRSGTVVPGFDAPLHLPATLTLYFALLLSVAAMILLIGSGALSEDGACDPPALVAGDLLMYLGLAYTVSGFFQPLMTDLSERHLPTLRETEVFQVLLQAVAVGTACVWMLAAYVGPIVSLLRAPYGRLQNAMIATGYLLLMVVLAYFIGLASDLQSDIEGRPASDWPVLRLLFLPIDWFAPLDIGSVPSDG